jgi:hypothetical protein
MDWARPEIPNPVLIKIGERLLCFSYGWHVVGAPRLEQQHGGAASLRKAARNDGTGRARSADDKVIGWLKFCREPALVGLNARVEFGYFQSAGGTASRARFQMNYSEGTRLLDTASMVMT